MVFSVFINKALKYRINSETYFTFGMYMSYY